MNWVGCKVVEIVPGKVSGVPVIRGSRVPVDLVMENHNAGESIEDIAYNFDLKSEDVLAVLAYAADPQPALRP